MRSIVLFCCSVFIALELLNCSADSGSVPCKQTKTVHSIDTAYLKYFPYNGGELLKYKVVNGRLSITNEFRIQPIRHYSDTTVGSFGAPERQQTCDSTITEFFETEALETKYGRTRKIAYDDEIFYFGGLSQSLERYDNVKNGTPFKGYSWLDSLKYLGNTFYNVLKQEKTGPNGWLIYWNDKVGFIHHETRKDNVVSKMSLFDYEL